MNTLTELPGFVTFKGAFLVKGQPGKHYFKAWDKYHYNSKEGSWFTDPRYYDDQTTFLVIELGDAGTVLEDYPLRTMDELWDIFLGTVIALAKGEMACEFEHRDLHENNICVSSRGLAEVARDAKANLRYGFSGLEVTLIDYGLSRATLYNGEVMFNDLEQDLEVFRGSDGHPQFNCYRKMRSHLFTSTRTMQKRAWHTEESRALSNGHDWSEHRPYHNVIWIQFLLGYLKKQLIRLKGPILDDLKNFNAQTVELSKRMDPRTKIENGAFESATQVLEYVIARGWVSCEQAEVVGTSEPSFLGMDNLEEDVKDELLKESRNRDEIDPKVGRSGSTTPRQRRGEAQRATTKKRDTKSENIKPRASSEEEPKPAVRRSPRTKKSAK
ncbi:putative serine/threonine-protein kinase haspin like protein [Glarea lozoyensis 74030]|nr:putative serine/threonine-protein kinase haspin like protein [Glarea lozoyensis 74030]